MTWLRISGNTFSTRKQQHHDAIDVTGDSDSNDNKLIIYLSIYLAI